MDWEYVAVRHQGGEVSLMNRGWSLWMAFAWDGGDGSVMIMRKPKCGAYDPSSHTVSVPRMWTEAELVQKMRGVVAAERDGLKVGDVRFVGGTRVMVGRPIPQEAHEKASGLEAVEPEEHTCGECGLFCGHSGCRDKLTGQATFAIHLIKPDSPACEDFVDERDATIRKLRERHENAIKRGAVLIEELRIELAEVQAEMERLRKERDETEVNRKAPLGMHLSGGINHCLVHPSNPLVGRPGVHAEGQRQHKRKYYIQQVEDWNEEQIAGLVAGLRHELWTDPVIQQALPPPNPEDASVLGCGHGFSVLVMTRTPSNLSGKSEEAGEDRMKGVADAVDEH